jgi:formiminoglutamase
VTQQHEPDRTLWTGRVDAEDGAAGRRWHQVVEPVQRVALLDAGVIERGATGDAANMRVRAMDAGVHHGKAHAAARASRQRRQRQHGLVAGRAHRVDNAGGRPAPNSAANAPPAASSAAGVPDSTTRAPTRTTASSADRIRSSRCEIRMVVRPRMMRR